MAEADSSRTVEQDRHHHLACRPAVKWSLAVVISWRSGCWKPLHLRFGHRRTPVAETEQVALSQSQKQRKGRSRADKILAAGPSQPHAVSKTKGVSQASLRTLVHRFIPVWA